MGRPCFAAVTWRRSLLLASSSLQVDIFPRGDCTWSVRWKASGLCGYAGLLFRFVANPVLTAAPQSTMFGGAFDAAVVSLPRERRRSALPVHRGPVANSALARDARTAACGRSSRWLVVSASTVASVPGLRRGERPSAVLC